METARERLRKYELPLMNHTRYFGVFMASHAIPDSIVVLHMGTGCKMKGGMQLVDYFRECFSQVCWTEVSGTDILANSHAMIEDTVLTNYERRKPGLIVVATSSVIEMTGFDMAETIEALRPRVGCPLIHVKTPGFDGDMYDGMADFANALLGHMDWTVPADAGAVNILGYPFDRYEMDHAGNLNEMRRLLAGMGLRAESIFFSGQKAAKLLAGGNAGLNVILPFMAKRAAGIEKRTGRPSVATDLPMGVFGTAQWMRRVGEAAGIPGAKTEGLIAEETKKVDRLAGVAKRFLREARILVMQSAPVAAGLTALAMELGVRVKNVVLLDDSLGGREEFFAALRRMTDREITEEINVLENPSWHDVAELPEMRYGKHDRVDSIIVSPSVEMSPFHMRHLKFLELGYPSHNMHFVYTMPYMGFNGVVAMAQRIMNAAIGRF